MGYLGETAILVRCDRQRLYIKDALDYKQKTVAKAISLQRMKENVTIFNV